MGYNNAIASQIAGVRIRALAEAARADEFIVSDQYASLMISQNAENRRLRLVFEKLFDPEGSEILLNPAEDYVSPGTTINYPTAAEVARQQEQAVIGYRLKSMSLDGVHICGIEINPLKSSSAPFPDGNRILIVAED
jgi:hypothetical protein